MNCKKFVNDLSAYLDGMLSPEAKARVHEHLQTCPLCKKEYEELKSVKEAVALLGRQTAKRNLEAVVLNRIKNGDIQTGLLESFISTAKTSLAAAIALFGIITIFNFCTPSMAATDNVEAINNYVMKGNTFAKQQKISDAKIMQAMLG
jgi:Predicted transmembrane transcriptional regulator (anti-sigma factor)